MEKQQVKSKERVKNHGEVFTNEREVNAMLDLVKEETENVDSTFLEPACGDGNFLAEILRRKLNVVRNKYKKPLSDYEYYAFKAITSLYGVDILQDNVDTCINRLYDIWNKEYKAIMKNEANESVMEAVKYVLSKNILCGDALTMLKIDGNPIIFAEWKFPSGTIVKRRDYKLSEILAQEQMLNEDYNLFNFCEEVKEDFKKQFDVPVKEYPLTDFREVQKYE